jgi:hypothetical protein
MTTLDDLLGYDEADREPEPPVRAGADATWWWLLKTVLLAAVVAVPVWGILRMMGLEVPYPLLLVMGVVGRALRSLLRFIAPRPLPLTLTRPSGELVSEDQAAGGAKDGLELAAGRWDNRLSWAKGHGDKGQFARTVQPKLVEIVDERLWLRHSVSRVSDPTRARTLLGEQLWQFVTQPVQKNMSPRDLAGLIALMEAL